MLNFFFFAGLHHFYLKNYFQGSLNLAGFLVGLILIFEGSDNGLVIGFSFLSLNILIETPALFRSQVIVKHYKNLLVKKMLLKTKNCSQKPREKKMTKILE